MTRRRWARGGMAALATLLALSGCGAPLRLYVNPQADMTLYKRVAVLPFSNLSGDPYAGGRVTRAFTTELVIADRFQLVDPAQVTGELDKIGGIPDAQGQIDAAKLRQAGEAVQATAFVRGAVTEFGLRHSGNDDFPVVSFDAEMIDAATANVVWRVSITESGKGRLPVIGGAGERTYGRVVQRACERAVSALRKTAF